MKGSESPDTSPKRPGSQREPGRILLAFAATLLVAQPAQPEQQPAPPVTYRVDVSLVQVDAVVTDEAGRPIRDLRREDFQVFEDGKPQKIDRVSFVEIPVERAEGRAPAPRSDVRTNLRRFDGRLYVLLLDDAQTAAARSERVKAAARRFVEQNLEPEDLAAVVHVSGAGGASQEFTSDRALLLASIDRFAGRRSRSETLNRVDEYNRQRLFTGRTPEKIVDLDERARAHDVRRVFDTIASIARRLAPVRGRRKALLWFGEGVAFDMFDLGARAEASVVLESSRAAVAAASRANLAIYGIDARGLAGLGDEAVQLTGVAEDPTRNLDATGLGRELLRSQDNLRSVSNETGGFAVVNTADLARAFERVVEENSAYYLLGYYPATDQRDGTYRRLEVRVSRPGARVRARTGYIAARETTDSTGAELNTGAPAALRDALASAVPVSGLPMAVHAAPFKGRGDKASVLVTVEYAAAAFTGAGDRLDASVIAVGTVGKVEASDHATITLNVKPDTREALQALGFRTHSRLELPPGRYQVRVAALAARTGLVGSVHQDLEVPDFSKAPLAMSGLIVTSVVAGLTPTARFDQRMREVLPAPPTPTRDFRNDEAIALFAEIYQAGDARAGELALQTRVRSDAGEVVFEREDIRTADDLERSRHGYSLQVPLRQVAPGDYVLTLEAESRGARPATVAREVGFRVWAVPSTNSAQPDDLPIVPVVKGAVSRVSEPREVVARTNAEWRALWELLSLKRSAPAVKVDDTMVVAVFLGVRPTAGYEAAIVGARREGDVLVIEWQELAPPDGGNPLTRTTPFVVVGVPQHAGEVRFRKVP